MVDNTVIRAIHVEFSHWWEFIQSKYSFDSGHYLMEIYLNEKNVPVESLMVLFVISFPNWSKKSILLRPCSSSGKSYNHKQ